MSVYIPENVHYTTEEKAALIKAEANCTASEAQAIAQATEGFTFQMLKDLATVLKTISRGYRR